VIGPSLKLGPDIWDRVLNSVPVFCYYIAYPAHFFFIFLQPTISSKSPLLLLQELPTGNLFFDRSRADPYSPLSSHQHCNKLWRGRELTIADIFDSWERSYEMLPSLLAAIQNSIYGTKYIIETAPSTKFDVEIFDHVA
jgi:hypothetical protein